ncbi:MAG: hypothetical protein NTX86_03190 [Candidatus Dependentiae bacterium]|nr:hypothetical protein [Candidatus Dependentiae bacterium]
MNNKIFYSMLLISVYAVATPSHTQVSFHNNNQHTITQSISGAHGVDVQTYRTYIPTKPTLPPHGEIQTAVRIVPLTHDHDAAMPSTGILSTLASYVPTTLSDITTPKLIVGFLGITYSTLLARLLYTSYYVISSNDTWASWKGQMTISMLNKIEAQTAQELLAAIQTRYANAPATACFLSPLVYFINDIDGELQQLSNFLRLHRSLDYFKMSFLFPEQAEARTTAKERIARLEYLKTVVLKYVSEYKVETNG